MIYPVKVYNRQGLRKQLRLNNKKSLDTTEALDHFHTCKKSGKSIFELSPHEKLFFKTPDLDMAMLRVEKKRMEAEIAKWANKGKRRKKKPTFHKIVCPVCKVEAFKKRKNAIYCSPKCQYENKILKKRRIRKEKKEQSWIEKQHLWKESLKNFDETQSLKQFLFSQIVGLEKIMNVLNGKASIIVDVILPRAKKGE